VRCGAELSEYFILESESVSSRSAIENGSLQSSPESVNAALKLRHRKWGRDGPCLSARPIPFSMQHNVTPTPARRSSKNDSRSARSLVLRMPAFHILVAIYADNRHAIETPERGRHFTLLSKTQFTLIAPSLKIVGIRAVLYESHRPFAYLQMVLANDRGVPSPMLAALDSERVVLRFAHRDFSQSPLWTMDFNMTFFTQDGMVVLVCASAIGVPINMMPLCFRFVDIFSTSSALTVLLR
jgi:hypothetical protein